MNHLLSIHDLSKQQILKLLKKAEEFKKKPPGLLLPGKILASCFFEPSTRTRLSFETAMLRLGGHVIGFADASSTSVQKGESLYDTMKVMGGYADAIVIRHPLEGAARVAASATQTPIINAGDGANQHPTQTLVDLFSIKETQGKLNHLQLALFGDLKYSRTAHSLVLACSLFDIRLYLVSPEQLTLPDAICHELRRKGIKFSFHRTIEEILPKVDILYMTRFQKERFQSGEELPEPITLRSSSLTQAKKNLKILHPLPRVDEIETAIDSSPHAYYFQQAANGLFVRQALLALLLESPSPKNLTDPAEILYGKKRQKAVDSRK